MPESARSRDSAHALLHGSPYVSYLYSYPHKTAYRPLAPARPLRSLWRSENRDALFLYMHIPFCEMRCGFCNLFTVVGTDDSVMARYVATLARQAERVSEELGRARFARVAIGGGTPTFLETGQIHAVLDIAEHTMGAELGSIPVSVETSPATATRERMNALVARGVDRISIGVQSFYDSEVRALGRAQSADALRAALERIRESGVNTLNIDLMYGIPGQTLDTWLASMEHALAFTPEELYLYPLYVRPLTGLGRAASGRARLTPPLSGETERRAHEPGGLTEWDHERLALYRAGRRYLLERGYVQVSMRMFRAAHAVAAAGPVYRCQEDGLIGLGAGARSYTDTVHYSSEYAVASSNVKSIIGAYIDRDTRDFGFADYGFELDDEDRQRRHIILCLLSDEGLCERDYNTRFGTRVMDDVPELADLVELGLARQTRAQGSARVWELTERGVERSDAIGPWLQSRRVRDAMGGYRVK